MDKNFLYQTQETQKTKENMDKCVSIKVKWLQPRTKIIIAVKKTYRMEKIFEAILSDKGGQYPGRIINANNSIAKKNLNAQ